jgi:hypothetical protein
LCILPVSVEVAKSDAEPLASNANVTQSKVECVSPHSEEGDENSPKENMSTGISENPGCTSAIRDSARSRLRRLGALYAGGLCGNSNFALLSRCQSCF